VVDPGTPRQLSHLAGLGLAEAGLALDHQGAARLWRPRDDGDGRVCIDLFLERVHARHGEDRLDRPSGCDHRAQARSVRVSHPAVRANEAQRSARLQRQKATLVEAHVNVGASSHREARPAVGV
jgi:hypothetical protein